MKPQDLEAIALSFSGGGFRAASYSLGCLIYLEKINLLGNVKFISSTSGGSITNLMYASSLFKSRTFDDFKNSMTDFLKGEELLGEALRIYNDKAHWRNTPKRNRNLINAFALAYNERLDGETMGLFSIPPPGCHLDQICVNATEFTNGHVFRFHSVNKSFGNKNGLLGNRFIFFKDSGREVYSRIRIGDVLAASSCFPSGFEPMQFPADFTHDRLTEEDLLKAISVTENRFSVDETYNRVDFLRDPKRHKGEKGFVLMDGGITDNQGIGSFILANDRRRKTKVDAETDGAFDLYISCDVSSHFMDGYEPPLPKAGLSDFLSIKTMGIALAAGVFIYPFVYWIGHADKVWVAVPSALVSILCTLLLVYLFSLAGRFGRLRRSPSTWSTILNKYRWFFLDLRLGSIRHMFITRAKSLLILSQEIFLKQIRRMYYDKIRGKPYFVQNTIYDLSTVNFSDSELDGDMAPSKSMRDVAETARTMGTTLWFDGSHVSKDMMANIVATGQFTTCYNLLKHLKKKSEKGEGSAYHEWIDLLSKDFEKFKANPFHLINPSANG
jgi:hypothetical protein